MKIVRRITVAAATLGAGAVLAVGTASAAHAGTVEQVEKTPWVSLSPGDSGYRVTAVRCFLDELGYHDGGCVAGEAGNDYTKRVTEAVRYYQYVNHLPVSGRVGSSTWEELRSDVGVLEAGDRDDDMVRGVQVALQATGPRYAVANPDGVRVTGDFGARTVKATKAFQSGRDIHRTGKVGPLTFKALFARQ